MIDRALEAGERLIKHVSETGKGRNGSRASDYEDVTRLFRIFHMM